jgi:hypothetical protein
MADRTGFTRRRLLYGLTAAGSAGALFGAGTAAFLRDDAPFPGNVAAAGALEIESEWLAEGNSVSLDFTGLRPGETRVGTARVTLRGNPAWVWFGSSCPTEARGIEDAVNAKITLSRGCDGRTVDVFGGYVPLREALGVLATGTLLTDGIMDAGETVCVEFRVTMAGDRNGVPSALVRGDEIDVSFTFVAEQARHNDAIANPFAGGDCDDDARPVTPGDDAACDCVELGKTELPASELLAVGDRLPVLGDDDRPTDYELVVTAVDDGTAAAAADGEAESEPTTETSTTETSTSETATPESTPPGNADENRGRGKPDAGDDAVSGAETDDPETDDPETVGVAVSLHGPESRAICGVAVKSGPETETYAFDPPVATTPMLYGTDASKAISHVVVSVCEGGN